MYNALSELFNGNDISSWRGEGRANQGSLAIETNDLFAAEKAFQGAITVEPYFEIGFINLADVYRIQQQPKQAEAVLAKGMKNLPKSSAIKYAYGLHLVRQKQLSESVGFFEEAMLLSPDNAQYAYTFVLATDGTGQSAQALTKLKVLIMNYADKVQLRELGLHLSQKLNNKESYDYFIRL